MNRSLNGLLNPRALRRVVTALSGTSVTFSIPSGTARVDIAVSGASLNGATELRFRVGDSGGLETTGYVGTTSLIPSGTPSAGGVTSGWQTIGASSAAEYNGIVTFMRVDPAINTWACSGQLYRSDTSAVELFGGAISLTTELTTIAMLSANGSSTFDAGTATAYF